MIKSYNIEVDTFNGKRYYRVETTKEGIKDFKTKKRADTFVSKYKVKYGMI